MLGPSHFQSQYAGWHPLFDARRASLASHGAQQNRAERMSALYPPACESSATPVVQGVPVQVASVSDSPAANTSAQEAMGKLNNFPPGLVKALVSSLSAFPVRFFVVDNSGSMQATDGNRLILDAQVRQQASKPAPAATLTRGRPWLTLRLTLRLCLTLALVLRRGAVGWCERRAGRSCPTP